MDLNAIVEPEGALAPAVLNDEQIAAMDERIARLAAQDRSVNERIENDPWFRGMARSARKGL